MTRTRTSSALELLVPLGRTDPGRSTGSSSTGCGRRSGPAASRPTAPPVVASAGGPARGVARDRRGGVRAARRRGLPREPPGRLTQVAATRRPATTALRRPSPRPGVRDRLPARPAGPRPVPARRLAAVGPAGAQRGAERAVRLPRRARRSPSCGRRSPTTSTASAVRPPTPTTIVVCTGFAQGLRLVATGPARRGARRLAVEDPSDPEYRADVLGGPASRSSASRSTTSGLRVDRLDAAGADAVARDRGPPVPDRRRAAARASGRARRLGRGAATRWSSRTTTTPSSATTASRSGRSRGSRRTASSTRAPPARSSRPACGWAGSSRRPGSPPASPRRSGRPISARRPSISWRSPTSSPMASSTATCAGCARSTAAGATRCSARSPGTCPSSGRSGPRPGCTSSPGCRPTSTRGASCRPRGSAGHRRPGLGPRPDRHRRTRRADLRLRRHRRGGDRCGRAPAGRDRHRAPLIGLV